MSRRCLLLLLPLSLVLVKVQAAEPDESAAHKAVLEAAGIKSEGPTLLDFFRKRTPSEADRGRLSALIRQLGADTFLARNKASEDLVAAGRKAIPFLRVGLEDSDREIVRRSGWCLREIEATPETPLVLAAAALVGSRKPAGATEALLAYLPFLEDEAVEQALFEAVAAVGVQGGKIDPALRAAVKSKAVRQRLAAAWVLGRLAKEEDRALVLPLLRDKEAGVRFRAAEALVASKDKRGLAGLLALLEKGRLDLASEAEGVLALVAGEKAPAVALGNEEADRKKCSQAWQGWWREHGAKMDLAKLDLSKRVVGLRLVAANSGYGGSGALWEYGADRKNRWEMRNVGGPFDVRVLPGGRLLVAEYNARRVSERDRTGKVLWDYALKQSPLEVQRLANGNTLIATNYEILEVTRAKTVAFTFNEKTGNIFSAQKLASGHILYGLYTGAVVEIDRTGKELHRFTIDRPVGLANIEVLPGGRYLMPLAGTNRVVEMDRTGKVLREVSIPSPTCVAVLPGGNLLVGSHILNNVREIDRKGTVLWQHKAEGQIFRVRVR
jgi:hypothetical protein